jgi:hypothetical protein
MDALPRSEASKAERFEAMSPNRGLAAAAG